MPKALSEGTHRKMRGKKGVSKSAEETKALCQREKRIHDFLHRNSLGVLSTVDSGGQPHGVVIYYVPKEFTVSFLTKTGTKKYDNLKHNNRVMLTIFEPETQTVAQVVGKAVEVTGNKEINRVANAVQAASVRQTGPGPLPVTKLAAGSYVAFTIEPAEIRMAVYATAEEGGYSDIFESVESFELI